MSDTPKRALTDLAGAIVAAREKKLAIEAAKIYPVYMTRSSGIPECARQGVYSIVAYDQRKPFDIHLQARFAEGDRQEEWIKAELGNIGKLMDPPFEVVCTQTELSKEFRDKYHLSGHIDGRLQFDGRSVVFEIKSMNPNLFDNIMMVSDLIADPFYSRYYRQMLAYMKANNDPECLLITSDCQGHWRFLVVPFSETDFEEMVAKKVILIHEYVKKNEGKAADWDLPERIPYNEDHCARCPFIHLCVPDVTSGARVRFADDEKMAAMIDRHQEIKPFADEFKAIDETLKDDLKLLKEPMLVVGDWIVEGKPQKGRDVIVPPTDPAKRKEFDDAKKIVEASKAPGEPSWRFKFIRQGGESPAKPVAEAAQNTPVPSPESQPVDSAPAPTPKSVAVEPTPVQPSSDISAPTRPQTPLGWPKATELPLSPVKSVTLQAEASNTPTLPVQQVSSDGRTEVAANGSGTADSAPKLSIEPSALERATVTPAKRAKIKI